MSTPVKEMTKKELAEAVHDILEWNHQWIDPYCPWCGAESYPVDSNGNPTGDDEHAEQYFTEHADNCAVTLIENIFAGNYQYLNLPTS